MQFSSLLALSASLLASQVSAQYFDPMMVNSIVHSAVHQGLSPNPAPSASANPKPHHYHDPMDVYNAPAMAPSMAMSMAPSMSMSMPHSMRPMHSSSMGAMHSSSMRPMHSHGAMSSMVTMASSSSMPHSMAPMATPASHFNHKHNGLQAAAPAPAPAAEHGGIAPIDPMYPGSNVAPVLMAKPLGKDEGNSFCMGICYPSETEAKCAKPYASPLFKKNNNCWMCCFTPGDF